jgi:hypothetical protein
MNFIKKILGIQPKLTSNEFVKKFINESSRKHVQLELYYKNKVILQVERLTYIPLLMKWVSIDKEKYKDGFVVHFCLESKNIEDNHYYKNYLLSSEQLNMVEYDDVEYGVISYNGFFEKDTTLLEITNYMRKVIDSVYKFPESNPQILFNLRYLKTVKK